MWHPSELSPLNWLQKYCLSIDRQFLFVDPVSWQTFQLTEGAAAVLHEAAAAIEHNQYEEFLADVADSGGWPQGLESLAHSLTIQHREHKSARSE